MHPTKCKLIERHGLSCMLCRRTVEYKELQWHHIKPKYASKFENEPVDDSYANGSLICIDCHHYIHLYSWWSREYHQLMSIVLNNKNKPIS